MSEFYIYRGSKSFFKDVKLKINPRTGTPVFNPEEDFEVVRSEYLKEENSVWTETKEEIYTFINLGMNMRDANCWYIQEGCTKLDPEIIFEGYYDVDYDPSVVLTSQNTLHTFISNLHDVFNTVSSSGLTASLGGLINNAIRKTESQITDNMEGYKEPFGSEGSPEDPESEFIELSFSASLDVIEAFLDQYSQGLASNDAKLLLIMLSKTVANFDFSILLNCLCLLDTSVISKLEDFVKSRENLKGDEDVTNQ